MNTAGAGIIQQVAHISPQTIVRDGLPALYPRLWRYALVLSGTRANADDLAQRACVRALENADKFQPGTHLDRWVFTIAKRLWLNEMRSQAVRQGAGLVAVEDVDIAAENLPAEANIFAREVLAAIGNLPEAQRETVALVYLEGYSYKEAARMLDIPIGTVMSRLAAARKTIARAFPDEGAPG